LGEVATIVRGASPRPIQSFFTEADDGVPWIKIGDVASGGKYITATAERVTAAGAEKSRRIHPGDFVLSNSMSFGRPYISKIEGCIHDGWLSISDFNDSFVPDFLYHLLRSAPVQAEFARRAGAGTVQNLNADIVKSVRIPVPSMEEQERIVAILDKFDALVNDLSSGLPAEIKARRQQYEHYRDRLLTFREAA
jgi:type I restriction enzyme S subunit